MIVLGIDHATTTGWATLDADGNLTGLGEIKFGGDRWEKFIGFSRWLRHDFGFALFDLVVYEDQNFVRGVPATKLIFGMAGILVELCEREGIPHAGIDTNTLKEFATGKRNASKSEMIAAGCRATNRIAMTEHQADAYWLARYGFDVTRPGLADGHAADVESAYGKVAEA